jgi:hypothetical protein
MMEKASAAEEEAKWRGQAKGVPDRSMFRLDDGSTNGPTNEPPDEPISKKVFPPSKRGRSGVPGAPSGDDSASRTKTFDISDAEAAASLSDRFNRDYESGDKKAPTIKPKVE